MSLVFFCPFTYMGVNNTKVLISLKPTTTENLIILRDLQALQVWTPYKQTFIDLSLIGKTRGFVLSSGAKSVKLLFLSYRKGGKWIVPASATVHLFSSGFRVNGAHLWPTVGPGVLDSVEQTKLWVPPSGGSDVGDDLGGISYLHTHGYLHISECSIYCFLPVPVVATVPALWLSLLEKHLLHRLPLCRWGGGVPSLPTQFRNNDFVFVSGHLHVKSGEKMSKSLKNYITIKVTCFS